MFFDIGKYFEISVFEISRVDYLVENIREKSGKFGVEYEWQSCSASDNNVLWGSFRDNFLYFSLKIDMLQTLIKTVSPR